jgi:N-acetylglucosaminyldiphosphoundecaprenol N-acetyl-beta-D-mannosaminyltransferase
MSKKFFLGIGFWSGCTRQLLESADRDGGLFTVPSAPSLAQMRSDPALMNAYQASDWAVVDGGYVALILRFFLGHNLPRISGLQILQRLLGDRERRAIPFHKRRILWVVPNEAEQTRIENFLIDAGFPEDGRRAYLAPFYKTEADFEDHALTKVIDGFSPDWIILCISGGKQEKLGHFLRLQNAAARDAATADADGRCNGPVILCTGGAISFLSGGQANIPTWADRLYLGWLFRICQSPKIFLPRYWVAAYEFPLLLWDQRGNLFRDHGRENAS